MDTDANDASLSSGSYTVLGRETPQLLEILKEFSVNGYSVKLLGLFWNPDLNCSLRHDVNGVRSEGTGEKKPELVFANQEVVSQPTDVGISGEWGRGGGKGGEGWWLEEEGGGGCGGGRAEPICQSDTKIHSFNSTTVRP